MTSLSEHDPEFIYRSTKLQKLLLFVTDENRHLFFTELEIFFFCNSFYLLYMTGYLRILHVQITYNNYITYLQTHTHRRAYKFEIRHYCLRVVYTKVRYRIYYCKTSLQRAIKC